MNRRRTATAAVAAALVCACLLPGCAPRDRSGGKRVVVLAFDGMDPRIVREMFAKGGLPNMKRLSETGGFTELWSSVPPQSPVAWSNFITGKNPGGHAIFDFIHRDPATYLPFLSTSETIPPRRTLALGDYILPLSAGTVLLKREGKAFWEYLEEGGIPATIFRIPSNFPPVPGRAQSLSGMGTPDLMGTYGIYQFFTSDPADIPKDPSGAEFTLVEPRDGAVRAEIAGPANSYRKEAPRLSIAFTAWIDEAHGAARIDLPGESLILRQGEWSDWLVLEFKPLALAPAVRGICRLYLKEVRPRFRLYVTPINIDPKAPALPIDTPRGYAAGVAEAVGYFYTQGMPENTKTLTNDTFTIDEFYTHFRMVLDENHRLFDHIWERYRDGLLFYYYSSTDLGTHIFWHLRDPKHPIHNAQARARLGDVIEETYAEMDGVVGKVMAEIGDGATLIVMSDHGFAPFYVSFNLNGWLRENGYLVLRDGASEGSLFTNVDWRKTRAYAIGLNSLYLNLAGRERDGIVDPGAERDALLRELAAKLEAVRDPGNGSAVIKRVYRADEVYSGEYAGRAPDLVVGYDWGYRTSWESALGDVKGTLLATSTEEWSGDHCGAMEVVPGILFSNKRIALTDPHLYDLTPSILAEFGLPKPADMIGRNVFEQ